MGKKKKTKKKQTTGINVLKKLTTIDAYTWNREVYKSKKYPNLQEENKRKEKKFNL